jgi:23S rRNA pseudouridine1911/1915/1917 synthase
MPFNSGYSYRQQIGVDAEGMTALAYVVARRGHSTREEWCTRFERGELELDGARARGDVALRPGQTLVWHRPPWNEPDVPRYYDLLHEDAALVAVVKPAGLPTMPSGGFLDNTLLTLVHERYPEARPLHRLGRHTSGIVLFARTHAAASFVARAWRDHAVGKRYRALVSGVPDWETLAIDAAIGPVVHPVLGTVHAASEAGKHAHSVARVLERRDDVTLLDVVITTGRPHQIRIHLAYAGYPLEGDPLYAAGGVPRTEQPGLPGDDGYQLHAARLRFVHPLSLQDVELRALPPKELCTGSELVRRASR